MSVKSPLRYHGGKSKLANWIISFMPPHSRYCEVYGGGLNVLFAKDPEGVSEYANDLNGHLQNFWAVLKDRQTFEEFTRLAQTTPLSEELFEKSIAVLKNRKIVLTNKPSVDLALDYFIVMRQSRQGLGKDYCTPTRRLRRGMNEQVSAWLAAVQGLPDVHARLQRVELRHQSALCFLKEMDWEETLFYLDPPYLTDTRSGGKEYGPFEMNDSDHELLLTALGQIKGKFVLSGYDNELYAYHEFKNGWRKIEIDVVASSSSKSDKSKSKRTECLWLNFEPEPQT